MKKTTLALALLCSLISISAGAELITVTWKTNRASPPPELEPKQQQLISLVRMGLATLPEPDAMRLAFLGSESMNMPVEDMSILQNNLNAIYEKIENDPLFSEADSLLPYCFSNKKPDHGLASVYLPDEVNARTPVILFLHGFGGSFQFYQYYLAEQFDDHIIICPAYGISMANVSTTYLFSCLEATEQKLGHSLRRPLLIGLSAGGFGGFREYGRNWPNYSGFICLAAYPPDDLLPIDNQHARIRLLAGEDEYWVQDRTLQKQQWKLLKADYDWVTIPGANHFFLLTHEPETRQYLELWAAELE